jgi:hypothetical protein
MPNLKMRQAPYFALKNGLSVEVGVAGTGRLF